MGTPIRNFTRPRTWRDHNNIFVSDVVITNIKERGDNNPNNSDNKKEKKKIKITKLDKYYSEKEKLELWLF